MKDITFEDKLWKAADKLRKKVEVHEYKYIVLGLLFLRYVSFAFEELREKLKEEYKNDPDLEKRLEDRDEYISEGALYVPENARWDYIKKNANNPEIKEIIDKAIEALEQANPKQLKDVIPKVYARTNLDYHDLAYLINEFSEITFDNDHKGKDIFGRTYEYFLGKFTEAEGRKGGEFYTPRSLTKLIVEILDVKGGRIFDPACGSGGFFCCRFGKVGKGRYRKALSFYTRAGIKGVCVEDV